MSIKGQFPRRGAACEGESGQPLRRCAPAPPFAPTQLFELRRCCAWLFLRFRTDPPSVRRCSARLIRQAETLELQPLRGLHQAILCSFLQNAHASGSLREPYGYRGARASSQALCASFPYIGEPGKPLSPLRRTAPLTQGRRRTTPQSAAADSSPYTGAPKNNPSGAARQLPLRGAFESVRPASGGRWERGCRGSRGSDSSPAGNAPRRGKMMCGFCAVAVSPQSAAAANGEETGGRCGDGG